MKVIASVLVAIVTLLATFQRSVRVYPKHTPAHWISVPSNLRQLNGDDTELEVLGVTATDEVRLGAFSPSQPFNKCDWWYRLEVEVRKVGEPFALQPTHFGAWIPRSSSRGSLAHPMVSVSGLEPSTGYRWIGRERVQPFTEFSEHGEVVRCEPGALRASRWAWHHVPFDFSFRTPAAPVGH